MLIRITRNTIARGAVAMAGELLDLSEREARLLIALGRAVAETIEQDEATAPPGAGETPETPAKSRRTK